MSTDSKMTWQRIVAILLGIPMIFITLEYWGYTLGKEMMNFGLSDVSSTLICAASGLLAGMMFVTPGEAFSKNLMPRIVAGVITGALSIWAFGGYLWIRGFPTSIYKIEIVLAGVLALLPGLLIYKLFAKQ